jgi:hypothetical protein
VPSDPTGPDPANLIHPIDPEHPTGSESTVRSDRPVARGAAAVAAVLALSVPFGLGWSALAPDVPVWVVEGGVVYADSQPEQLMAADGWFLLLGLPVGLVAAVVMWLVAHPLRGVPGLVLLSLACIGTGLLAWWLGRQIGLADYQELLAAAEVGTQLSRPPDLRAVQLSGWPPRVTGVTLVPALTAAVTYTLLAAWSRFPQLRP